MADATTGDLTDPPCCTADASLEGESDFARSCGSTVKRARGDDTYGRRVVPAFFQKRIGVGVSKSSFGSSAEEDDSREQDSEDWGASFAFVPSFAYTACGVRGGLEDCQLARHTIAYSSSEAGTCGAGIA